MSVQRSYRTGRSSAGNTVPGSPVGSVPGSAVPAASTVHCSLDVRRCTLTWEVLTKSSSRH